MTWYIRAKNLSLSYGAEKVVEDLSFSVSEGDFFAIVGPNGGGKSTLIKALMGIITPVSGTLERHASLRGKIGYMPQSRTGSLGGFPATVYEVVASAIRAQTKVFKKLSHREKDQIESALGLLSIESLRNRRIDELSGGQRQRVFLARAFSLNPSVLILDEPTGALDQRTRNCFYETLQSLNKKERKTIIMVTHDAIHIESYVTRVLALDRRPLFIGPAADYSAQEKNHYFNHAQTTPCTHGGLE
ncbi:metal ABC transporter ATP-binding protein [Chitinivibrio alkaliphilus]|uniref:ABC transporter, ATP-binding protein n=1 Tax=Chitinivibrio alkaliphilus ACht1 TaxID=1313304 RepID=U7DEK3_9BACT|nr:ABC transporter ATP-binding protein [Chitinivibrio alkaliphilus]ERP39361.1 ABC transporter, ATP-binding protein [Chitinivibrio alkaliphilus ACht1]